MPRLFSRIVEARPPLIVVAVDSAVEANYLLEKAWAHAAEQGLAFERIELDQADPYLLWEDLLGTASDLGLCFRFEGVVGVWNSVFVPVGFLTERLPCLRSICASRQVSLVLPLFHGTIELSRSQLHSDSLLEVPRFQASTKDVLQETAMALLGTALPGLDPSTVGWLAGELIASRPSSRVELEHWINYYAAKEEVQELGVVLKSSPPPPPVPRLPTAPLACPTRDQLAASLSAIRLKLDEASNRFQSLLGRPLVREVSSVVDPFDGDQSLWWFVGTVSHLASTLFDATDRSLDFFCGFSVERGAVVATERDSFFDTLRSLRTAMQHGLQPSESASSRTLESVRQWFRRECGVSAPQRQHWRVLTGALLREWDRAAARLVAVLRHLDGDRAATASVEAQLRLWERRLTKQEWRTLCREVMGQQQFGDQLDLELLLDRELPSMQRELRDSAVARAELVTRARQIVEDRIVRELAKCPIEWSDLRRLGVPDGPLLGKAMGWARETWTNSPRITKETLLLEIEARWKEA